MKVIVCGGRDFRDERAVAQVMALVPLVPSRSLVIEGGAVGADSLAAEWARSSGVHVATISALWGAFGNSAGPRRNAAMLSLGPDLVIAFPGGAGTADMVRQALHAGVPTMRAVNDDGEWKLETAECGIKF